MAVTAVIMKTISKVAEYILAASISVSVAASSNVTNVNMALVTQMDATKTAIKYPPSKTNIVRMICIVVDLAAKKLIAVTGNHHRFIG